jgi:hypothetical protein
MYTQNSPFQKKSKIKGGGTKKVCLPASKVRSMSKAEKDKVVRAKRSAAASGKYKRSSKSNVKVLVKKELHYVIGLKKKIGLTLQQESHAEINR